MYGYHDYLLDVHVSEICFIEVTFSVCAAPPPAAEPPPVALEEPEEDEPPADEGAVVPVISIVWPTCSASFEVAGLVGECVVAA
jgi:hypothetical protein